MKLLLAGLLAFALIMGCKKKDKTQSHAPAKAGERGTACESKNDCGAGLSCLVNPATGTSMCQPANFSVEATGKECYRRDCTTTKTCCGDKSTEAPAKCRARETYCVPEIPDCNTIGTSCLEDNECTGNGVCGGSRSCDSSSLSCSEHADCDEVCDFSLGVGGAGATGYCSIQANVCSDDSDCFYQGDTCGIGFCTCDNPDYNPLHEICSDPDCDDVCTLICDNNLCVEDETCKSNDDCLDGVHSICATEGLLPLRAGECVECERNTDCDELLDETDDDDICDPTGTCITPCEGDAECGLFEACQEDGTCLYVGCRSDQECILLGAGSGGEDRRLLTCVEDELGVGVCTVECEIDAHCPQSSKCEDGTCKYLGCAEDTDCYSLMGLNDWVRDEDTPWTPVALCLDPAEVEDE